MVQKNIKVLLNLLANELNEKELVKNANHMMESLRAAYKLDRNSFSKEDISRLKLASEQIKSIEMFIEEMDEFEFIDNKEELNEVIGRLYPIVEKTNNLKVSERVKKEIRELLTRMPSLKSAAIKNKEKSLINGINALNSNRPKCKKCGSVMVLREGNDTFFWGCSEFPKCWAKKWLTKDELNKLS